MGSEVGILLLMLIHKNGFKTMPEREKFPRHYFDSNPYESNTPEETYERIQWGNTPRETFEVEAPEPLVTLGDVAQIFVIMESSQSTRHAIKFSEHEAPFLALGTHSNKLYFVPKIGNEPVDIPEGPFEHIGIVTQLDYYSDKGGEPAYYYHEHEPPYPHLYQNRETGVCVLIPSECEDGSKSYAVGDEGVIG